jgi:acyl-CoA dehydrogenase
MSARSSEGLPLVPEFARTDEERALARAVGQYLDRELPYERVLGFDEDRAFPIEVWRGLAGLGLLGIGIPEELGGSGGGAAEAFIVTAEIARRFPSLATDYVLVAMTARTYVEHGTPEQQKLLEGFASGEVVCSFGISEPDGGTDALALRTRAREVDGEWRIDGRKLWISMAQHADHILLLARTDEPDDPARRARGISLIQVPMDQPGITVRKVPLAGMRAAGSCEVLLDDAVAPLGNLVGERGRGFHGLRASLAVERVLSAAISNGIGRQALDLALTYARERQAFGRTIGEFQAVQHRLVDAVAGVSAAQLLVERAVRAIDDGVEATAAATLAKAHAAETTAYAVDVGMRTMAAMGLAAESQMQMLFRDARLQLFSPVSNDMARNLSGEALGLGRSY